MKIFTKKTSMLVIMAALSGITAEAQNYKIVSIGDPITNLEDLTNGCYVVFEKNNAAGSYVYELADSRKLKNSNPNNNTSGIPSDMGAVWKVSITENPKDAGYKYSFQSISGNWMPQLQSLAIASEETALTTVTEENKGYYTIVLAPNESTGSSVFNIKCKAPNGGDDVCFNGNYMANTPANSFFYGWYLTSGANSKHKIHKVTLSVEQTISDANYATANYPFAVDLPDNVEAYYVNSVNDNQATLSPIENTVPANSPFILKGEAGTYGLNINTENTDPEIQDNKLSGTLSETMIPTTTNAYILGNKNDMVGFYQMDENDRALAANKAYLELPATVSAVRSIIFSDGTTTGIESTVAEGTETEEYYDLQGRRVMNPTKGIYVTKSGKKVVINK